MQTPTGGAYSPRWDANDAILFAQEALTRCGKPIDSEKLKMIRERLTENPATIPFFLKGINAQMHEWTSKNPPTTQSKDSES